MGYAMRPEVNRNGIRKRYQMGSLVPKEFPPENPVGDGNGEKVCFSGLLMRHVRPQCWGGIRGCLIILLRCFWMI